MYSQHINTCTLRREKGLHSAIHRSKWFMILNVRDVYLGYLQNAEPVDTVFTDIHAPDLNEWQLFQHCILWSADYIFGRVC